MMARWLTEYFANSLWQAPLLAGAAWFLVRMSRPRVQVEHAVWLVALGLAVVMPLRGISSGAGFEVSDRVPSAAPSGAGLGGAVPSSTTSGGAEPATSSKSMPAFTASGAPFGVASGRRMLHLPEWLGTRSLRLTPGATRFVCWLYLATVALGLLRLVRAWGGARLLVKAARPAPPSARIEEMLDDSCREFGLEPPRLLVSEQEQGPMAIGVVRPLLLLPADFLDYTDYEASVVVRHELAHVKRRDYFVNLVCQVVGLPVSYHPAVEFVQQRVRQTREMICDEMAADGMRTRYARCLVGLAQRLVAGRRMAEHARANGLGDGCAQGLFDHNRLEERVMRLVDSKAVKERITMANGAKQAGDGVGTGRIFAGRAVRLVSGAVAMAVVVGVAAMIHLSPTYASSQAGQVGNATLAASGAATSSAAGAKDGDGKVDATGNGIDPSGSSVDPEQVEPDAQAAASAVLTPNARVAQPAPSDKLPELNDLAPLSGLDGLAALPGGEPINIVDGKARKLTPEERAKLEQQLKRMEAEIDAATKRFDGVEFRKQMADAMKAMSDASLNAANFNAASTQKQLEEASRIADDPQFRKRMDEMKLQLDAAKGQIDSPEFRKEMEEAQRAVAEATARMDSQEFRKAMDKASKCWNADALKGQVDAATQALQSTEFKEQMAEVQRKMAEAPTDNAEFKMEMEKSAAMLNDPKFKKQMEDAQREAAEAVNNPEFKARMAEIEKQLQSGDLQREIDAAQREIRDAEERLKELQVK